MNRIRHSIAGFWRNSRNWSLGWQLVVALLFILVGVLVAATISDALYGSESHKGTNSQRQQSDVTATSTTTSGASPGSSPLIRLRIASLSHADTYDRTADFGGWVDIDGCKDTRAEVLIRTSAAPVTFNGSNGCTVKTGQWTDPWSGVTTTVAHDFDIDHTVPLGNAWYSGAWSWTHDRRIAYTNDVGDVRHLVPIVASTNEAKGDRGPERWKPAKQSAWCAYALTWDHIKAKWDLSATRDEWNALVAMAETC